MNILAAIITSIFVGVAVGYLLQFLTPRARIFYWHTHDFTFVVPLAPPAQPATIRTHALTVQNWGRTPATDIEIAHAAAPAVFHLWPSRTYTVDNSSGPHIVRVQNLGAKEWFLIELLTVGPGPMPALLYVRSREGQAQWMPVQFQRVFPKWFNYALLLIFAAGAAFILYWIARSVQLISQNVH